MNKYALVKNGSVVDFRTLSDEETAEFKPRLIGGVPMWRPYTLLPAPSYDPAIEKLVEDPPTITDTAVMGKLVVVPLTTAEKDAVLFRQLDKADAANIRIIEDLVDLLVAKSTFALTELPQEAQDKLAASKALRAQLS